MCNNQDVFCTCYLCSLYTQPVDDTTDQTKQQTLHFVIISIHYSFKILLLLLLLVVVVVVVVVVLQIITKKKYYRQ